MNNFPKWDDITASSTYQSLAAEEQERARRQYFDDFIAPRTTPSTLSSIRSEWDSMTMPDAADAAAGVDDERRSRTWGEAAKDTGAALMQGGASVAEGVANMADLGIRAAGLPSQMLARAKDHISGGTENLERHQREWRSPGKAMLDLTGNAVDYWQDKKSEPLKQAQQNLSRAREEADGFWNEVTGTIRVLIEDPMLVGDVLASSAAYMALPAAAARRTGSVAWRKAVEAGKDRAQTIAEATRASMMGGAVTGGAMEGSSANIEAREQIMQMTPDQLIRGSAMYADLVAGGMGQEEAMETIAFRAGLTAQAISTPISILSSYATGGAKVEAQFFTGQGIKNFFAAVGAEAGQETLQEGGNVLGQNIGIRSFADGQRTLSEGLGQSAVLGATMGASQAGAMRLTGGLVSEIGRGLTPVMEGDNATTTNGETVIWIDDNGNQKEAKVSGYAGEVGGTHMVYAEVDGREIPVPMDQLYRPNPEQQPDQQSDVPPVQHTTDEVAAFAADRIDELNQYSDLSPEEATELRYLEANLDNPQAIATAYSVEIIPDGIIKRSRDSIEPLTDDDRASPIPDSLIMGGRQTIATTAGELTATQMLEAAGLPPVNTRVSIGGKNGVILDAFEGDRAQGAIIQMDDGTYVTRNLEDLAGQVMPEQAVEADAQLSRQEIIDRRAEVAMQEILQDIESGVVPDSVSSFEDIQNHTDANMYINDADRKDNLIGRLGREQGWSPEEYSKISNEIIAAVDSRLQARRPSAQSAARPVLQNRDRSTPAMITQMRSIAANPDYGRLGVSRDFSSGAPVVEPGANIPPARMGRTDYAVTGQGRRIPVQYAVVEASEVLPSNDVQGSALPGYDTGVDGQSRAIAGNGRMAGLQAAYRGENAQSYRDELAQDGMHGIDPAEIQGMRSPVLVRVMPAEEVTQNIGDESNVTGTATLSASEQARNDARRLDVAGITYSEDGQITPESARQFIQAMPASEQSGLLDGGQPSRQAYDRLSSAIFSEAYDSDALVRLQSQATDPEARTIMTALAFAAPRMATLKGQGNYDLRALVTEAAETAVNARRAGQTLSEYIKQGDISLTAETLPFLEMFAENIRSAKRIGERLSQWADALYAEATKTETDMFGDVPRISPEQITQEVIRGQENQRPNEDAGRPADEPGVAERQAPEPREQRGVEEPQEVIYRANGQPFATQKSADLAGRAREGNFDVVEVEGGWALTPSVLQPYTGAELAERAQAKEPHAARAEAPSPDDFVLSGSNSEADQAAARGQLSMFEPRRSAPHQLDMFRRMERASKIDPYAKAEQREGTTEKQRELGRSALKSLYENLTRRYRRATGDDGEISLLGAQILENFAAGKPNQLVGKKVESHSDLAAIAQVYRDPRFETFRIILVRDAEVVSEVTMTSRMPSYVTFGDTDYMLNVIRDRMAETGANGYYMMHNHPSGKSNPSRADVSATEYIALNVPGFIEHIIIDNNEYHVIDSDGVERMYVDDSLRGEDFWSTPAMPHPLLGTPIQSAQDLARAGKQFESGLNGSAVIINTRADGLVNMITSVPERALSLGDTEGLAVLRRIMRTAGAGGYNFMVVSGDSVPRHLVDLVENGVFTDIVATEGNVSASSQAGISRKDPMPSKAMYLSDVIEGYQVNRKIIGTDPLLAGWTMLSLNDLTFSLPISKKKGMVEMFDDGEAPDGFVITEAEELALQLEGDIEATNAWRAVTPGGSKASIYENKDSVWIDVSDVKTGEQGKRIYNYVANYAHNNGKTFIGDPAGLSPVAQSRRLENMIASALKFGTTKHLWPHDNQIKGNDQVQPINWKDGDDAHNLREMIIASHNYVTAQFPEIKNLYYNPDDDAFIHRRSGREYTREKFGDLAAFRRARAPAADTNEERVSSPVTAGGTTLERAVFTHTLLYGTSEEQSSVLARLGSSGPQRLEGVAYSLTDDGVAGSFRRPSGTHKTQAFKKWFGDSKVVDENGEPLVVHHGTQSAEFSVFRPSGEVNMFGTGEQYHFTDNRQEASTYAEGNFETAGKGRSGTGRVLDVYLKMERPADLRFDSWNVNDVDVQGMIESQDTDGIMDALKAAGYDGIIHDGDLFPANVQGVHYVVFRPEQIKSATDNNGDFGPANPDIRFSLAPPTESAAFKRWFGDSKIVDENGDPLVVYHGTAADFDSFDPKRQFGGQLGDGFYFSPRASEANAFAAIRRRMDPDATPSIVPVYLSLQNPYIIGGRSNIPIMGINKRVLSGLGHDGVLLLDETGAIDEITVFEPNQIKSATGNTGAFDPNNPDIRFQEVEGGADGSFQKLSAIHNLSAEGLIFADRLGGLAAPSVAVVKDGMMVEGFGEITLIGRRELGDPNQTPIYDADAWTARFPDPEYKKPKIKSVDELTGAVRPYGELMGDDISSTLFHTLANRQDFKEAESSAFRSLGMRAMYLDQEHGIKVKPKMRQAVSSNELSAHPKVAAFFKKNQKLPYEQQYEQGAEELGRILEEVILEKYPGDARGKRIASMYVDDGKAFFGAFDRMKNEQRLVGKKVVDTPATHKTIERRMKGKEAAYKKWVNSKITEVMGEPYIRIGRSLKPFTLDNIVKHMTSHSDARGREQHMTFGAGKARASVANRFRDLAEMRNTAKDNVKSGADLEAAREKADAILDEYRSAIVDFSTYLNWKGEVDIWEALDASMMALSDGMANQLSRGAEPALKAAFKKHGFRMPDAKTMKLAVKAMNAMYEAPVPYYESKPQRAVSLNEFAGAVIPQDASPEVIAVLDKNDIPYKKYKGDGLLDAVNKFRNELSKKGEPVLFRLPDGTAAKATKRFNDQAEKVASDLRERLKALNVPDRIAVNVVEAIGSKGQKKRVSGSGIMGVIDIALNANDAVHTLNHEVIHALKSMGLFRDAEWRTLEKAARNHPRRAEIENRYAGQNLTDAQMTEEVIAEMYADWAGSRNSRGFIRTAFERVRDVLNAIAEALAGNGFLTADSVMRRIEAGAVGERDAPRAYSPDEAAFEMAAMGSDGQEGGFSSSLPQTETPAFKKWFGDSKVVDAEGKPLVVYHGTTADITTFETSSSGEYGPGIYLSYRPESAMKWAAIAGGRGKGPATTMPVYVRMEKPFEVRKTDLQEMALEEDADQEPIGMREVHRRLKKQGYDGIIGTGLSDSDVQIVVFDPKQIKSATGNTGAFDPNNPDIRFQETEGGADGSFTAPWSRPQYQLTPGMFNPEQARRAQQIIGGQPPSPPGPGGEVNTDIRIDPFSKSAMKLIGFFESATDKMRRSKNKELTGLANKIDNYYNKAESRLGMVNGKIRPILRRMGITPVTTQATVQKTLQPFSEYWRHHDNGRTEQAEQIYRDSSQETRDMIDTVKDLYSDMGDINQDVGVQVFDSNLVDWAEVQKRVGANGVRIIRGQPPSRQQAKYSELLKMHSKQQDLDMDAAIYDLPRKGGWRLIGKFKKGGFWPRAIKPEVQRLLGNPDSNPELRDQLIAALINEGHIDHKSEFVKYLSLYFANEVKSDYFAGIEKARTNKLPEIFYDYSWQTFQQYSSKWSSRVSQIEQFGQQTGEGTMDAFDELIGVTNDMATRNYVGTVRDQVYNRRGTDAWNTFWSHMNILATGLQLGNPATATLNIIGGTQLNVTMFGWKRVAQAYIEVAKDWERIQQEGVELGILGKDVLNILRDADSNSGYLEDAQKVKDALSSFTKFTMTWGGYRGTENIIRTTGMIAARIQLTDALKAWNTKPGGSDAKKYSALMKRHRIDQEKLIMENGSGPETQKYLQVMVNIPQGSYRIDMTPVYVDTQVGRFFFKYQKFGTQVSRMFWQNQLQPFIAKPSIGTFLPLLHYFATAFIGGTAVLAARSLLFGYGDPGPEWEDLKEALKDEDKSAALGMIFDRAYYSMMAGSALGFFGSYVQFTKDVADQQRVRNPMDPPGLASIDAVTELVQRWIEQGRLTTGDIDYVTEGTFALYRGYKRMSLSALETVDADISAVRLQTAKRNRTYIWKTARRYAEDNGIESRKTSSGRFGKSPMSPAKQAIRDAITVGDAARAKLIYLDAMAEAPPEQRKAVRDSLRDAVRSGQPIKIAGSTSSIQKEAFLQWAKEHVSPANYQRIIEADADYRRTAVRAGIW